MAELSPVKIKKIFEAGKLIYPATILDAVKDGSKTITVNGVEVENPSYGKTVREIIVDNEKVTAAALNDHETRILDLESKFDGEESVDAKIEAEKTRAEGAEGALSDRLDTLEGEATVAGSVAEAKKAADAAQADVDALEELVGEVPESAEAETVVGYAEELVAAEEVARKAQIGELGKVSTEEGAAYHTVKSYVDAAIEAVNGNADDLDDRIADLEATHATKEDGSFKTVSEEVSEAIAEVVADAPESFDTLKEIADWIQKDAENANGFDAAQRIVDLEEKVGEAGVKADPENNVEGKEATGLYKAIEDAIADANSAIDDLDASNNVSDAVAGIAVQVDQEDGAIAKPVVTVTAAEVTCTEGTAEVAADLAVDVEASVLDGSAVAAIKSYVDNHFATEDCTDTTDYADVF